MRLLLLLLPTAIAAWKLATGARLPGSPRHSTATTTGGSILDLAAVEQWCTANGLKERHLFNVYRHLFQRDGEFTADSLHEDAEVPLKHAQHCAATSRAASRPARLCRGCRQKEGSSWLWSLHRVTASRPC